MPPASVINMISGLPRLVPDVNLLVNDGKVRAVGTVLFTRRLSFRHYALGVFGSGVFGKFKRC